MNAQWNRIVSFLTPLVFSTLALLVLIGSGLHMANTLTSHYGYPAVVLLCLGAAVIVADRYPIHIHYRTKVTLTSAALYLLAVLVPSPLAALTAGASMLAGEVLQRASRGSTPSDIIITGSRWVLVTWISSWIAHLGAVDSSHQALLLVGAATSMLIGDMITSAMHLSLITGEPLRRVLVTIVREGFLVEAVQYLLGMLSALAAVYHTWALVLLVIPIIIVHRAFKSTKEMHDSTRQLLEQLADTVDLRDPYTGGHSRQVTAYCEGILRELGLAGPDCDLIIAAARVHDIGKIAIPDGILNKPGQLSAEEWATMASHAALGATFLTRYPDFARGAAIVRHHHERWDGKGYPDRLKGFDIPFGARVIAVADSFDAMTSDRPYRRGMPVTKAAQILHEGRNEQWDAQIVDAFLESIADRLERATELSASLESSRITTAASYGPAPAS